MKRRTSLLVSLVAAGTPLLSVALVAGTPGIAPAAAAPLTSDPAAAAVFGAHWLAGQVNAEGFVPGPTLAPNVSATLEVAMALAAARTDEATFDRIVAWALANPESIIVTSGLDDPGRIGYLLMLADIAGISPTSFGGVNLLARLDATLGDFAPGLYGGADPTYDGSFRQGLALVGLGAVGATLPGAAVQWLVDQQCGPTPPDADGGYVGYRADTSVDCPSPDPLSFSGPDTNSTAMAAQGLAAAGRSTEAADALDFLDAAQAATGGFPFITGGDVDPNSTALVIQAIVAAGENPSTGRWVAGADTPYTSLLAWQIGTEGAVEDQGAFASPFSGGFPDLFATRQAVWGAAGASFPFAFDPYPDVVPTTTVPVTSPTTTTPIPVVAPAFAG